MCLPRITSPQRGATISNISPIADITNESQSIFLISRLKGTQTQLYDPPIIPFLWARDTTGELGFEAQHLSFSQDYYWLANKNIAHTTSPLQQHSCLTTLIQVSLFRLASGPTSQSSSVTPHYLSIGKRRMYSPLSAAPDVLQSGPNPPFQA